MWDIHRQTTWVTTTFYTLQYSHCYNLAKQIFKYPNKLSELTLTYRRYDSNFVKPISYYRYEKVLCGGKKGNSVMLKMTSCVGRLVIFEIKVWGVELLNCYNSDDQCGRFNNVD